MKAFVVFLNIISLVIIGNAGNFYKSSNNITYYIEEDFSYSWLEAFLECSSRKMILLTIESEEKMNETKMLLKNEFLNKTLFLWSGAVGRNRNFSWISNGKPVSTMFWNSSNTNNRNNVDKCLLLDGSTNGLNDYKCYIKMGYACEVANSDLNDSSPESTDVIKCDMGLNDLHSRDDVLGMKGDKGEPGLTSASGPKGDRGYPGMPGQKGDLGPYGFPGLSGPKGDKGEPGMASRSGPKGVPGLPGPYGIKGDRGPYGFPGFSGPKGDKGEPGMASPPGPKGVPGYPGPFGDKGDRGSIGIPGLSGMKGEQGIAGRTGAKGQPGPKGDACLTCNAAQIVSTGNLLIKHSQSEEVPSCEPGHITLWSGYSLYYVDGNEYAHNQDLGSAGSCVQRFSTLPVLSCNANNMCKYATGNDKSYWLTTSAPVPMMPVPAKDVRRYISRCIVCEAPANVIAVHSQALDIPMCPNGWEGLWIGYSFMMTAARNGGAGQDLSSPGSCLQDFRTTPLIQCNGGNGHCDFHDTMSSFWLVAMEEDQQFKRPAMETLKAGSLLQKVSRCQVCIRNSLM